MMRNCCLALAINAALAGPATAGDWVTLTADLVKENKPGFGGVSGVLVDRTTGHVFVWLSDKGLFHSTDRGQTWKLTGKPAKGRTETPGCILVNPTGPLKTMIIPLVYGSPIIVGDLAKLAWTTLDKQTMHVDWVALDWTDPA